jgi:hypothetical protein
LPPPFLWGDQGNILEVLGNRKFHRKVWRKVWRKVALEALASF